jgi:hypothetical protein
LKALSAALALSILAAAPALADALIRPDPRLTPGAVATTDANLVCSHGYAKSVRHTSGKLKAFIYHKYGINRRGGHYEIDHLIPLGLGGADVAANLWPESWDTRPWSAERRLPACRGVLRQDAARAGAAGDRQGLDRGL